MIFKRITKLVFNYRHGNTSFINSKVTKAHNCTTLPGIDKEGRVKPNIWSYYSKREIATLFLQPFAIIVVYLVSVWHIFKYYCDVKDVQQFMSRVRWIRGNARFEDK